MSQDLRGDALHAPEDEIRARPPLPCVLLLDTSGSMGDMNDPSSSIFKLNEGLKVFERAVKGMKLARDSVEICIITFGQDVKTIQEFVQANDFVPPVLDGQGETPMGEAITVALRTLEERKNELRSREESYFRPWLFLLTDGAPTDDVTNAAAMLQQAHDDRGVVFFAVGMGDAVDFDTLKAISPKQKKTGYKELVREPVRLPNENSLYEMFVWLVNSQEMVTNSSDDVDTVKLPLAGWAEVPSQA
jgi:uncharacterized protein YegL